MKTQILRLESYDDVISARDKMSWSKAARILLVWPENGKILRERLDLILLRRHAQTLGAQLALITRERQVLEVAKELRIPVYSSLAKAQKSHWRVRNRRPDRLIFSRYRPQPSDASTWRERNRHEPVVEWISKPVTRLAFFALGLLAVLAILGTILPGAVIYLEPESEWQTISLRTRVDPDANQVNYAGVLPAKWFSVTVEGLDSRPSSGSRRFGATLASGRVVFTNLTDQTVNIPVGLVIRTLDEPEQRFSTTQAGRLPPGPGTNVSLPVLALAPGSTGNQPAGSLIAIESSLGPQISVINPLPTRGGTDRQLPVPTGSDRAVLRHDLESALGETALKEISSRLSDGDLLLSGTLTCTQVLEESYLPQEETTSEALELRLRLEFQAQVVSADDMKRFAGFALDANMRQDYSAVADSLIVQARENASEANTSFELQITGRRMVQKSIPGNSLAYQLRGVTLSQAQAILENRVTLNAAPVITIQPSWWPRLPVLPMRISFSTLLPAEISIIQGNTQLQGVK